MAQFRYNTVYLFFIIIFFFTNNGNTSHPQFATLINWNNSICILYISLLLAYLAILIVTNALCDCGWLRNSFHWRGNRPQYQQHVPSLMGFMYSYVNASMCLMSLVALNLFIFSNNIKFISIFFFCFIYQSFTF